MILQVLVMLVAGPGHELGLCVGKSVGIFVTNINYTIQKIQSVLMYDLNVVTST